MGDTKMLTDDEVNQIAARADKATAGPWVYFGEPCDNVFWGEIRSAAEDGHFAHITDTPELDERDNDMEFIAHARADIPALCATVRALRAALEESEAHNRVLHDRLAVADGVYDAKGEYTILAQNAINRATSELRDQLAAVTQERDRFSELASH